MLLTTQELATTHPDLHKRFRRQNRALVLFSVALGMLLIGLGWVGYQNANQGSDIRDISIQQSACSVDPDGLVCKVGHANSVALTTHEEACFILAQGGIQCRPALDGAQARKDALQAAAGSSTSSTSAAPNTEGVQRGDLSGYSPGNPTVPGASGTPPTPRPPKPQPAPPSTPTPSVPPRDGPVTPQSRPLITLPDQLKLVAEVCVNALGIKVIC